MVKGSGLSGRGWLLLLLAGIPSAAGCGKASDDPPGSSDPNAAAAGSPQTGAEHPSLHIAQLNQYRASAARYAVVRAEVERKGRSETHSKRPIADVPALLGLSRQGSRG